MKNLGLGYYIFFTIILFSTISFAQEQELRAKTFFCPYRIFHPETGSSQK